MARKELNLLEVFSYHYVILFVKKIIKKVWSFLDSFKLSIFSELKNMQLVSFQNMKRSDHISVYLPLQTKIVQIDNKSIDHILSGSSFE